MPSWIAHHVPRDRPGPVVRVTHELAVGFPSAVETHPQTPRTITADRGDTGERLDLVLRRHLHDVPGATRTRIQSWIEAGRIAVNGILATRTSARIAFGDSIAVSLADLRARAPMLAEASSLDVLYEDDRLLAINKPAGMIVHPSYRHPRGSLMNALLWYARSWPEDQRPSLVGRLDKLTSGIVLVAKRPAVHAAMQRVLTASTSVKEYLAVVHGPVNAERGEIDLKLGRDPLDRRRVVISPTGAASLTRFERVASGSDASLLCCRLMTGRMHQIRVHLAARGWPIVGDPRYGDPARTPAFHRQALHAWRLSFVSPGAHQATNIEAPLPDDLRGLLAECSIGLAELDTRLPPDGKTVPRNEA